MPVRGKPVSVAALAQQLMAEVLRFEWPADQVIAGFFKRHPQLGARDRASIADGIWAKLRAESPPPWIVAAWESALGTSEAAQCAEVMRTAAPFDLRVNTMRCRPEQAIAELAHDDIRAHASSVLTDALRVEGKPGLGKARAFLNGSIEVQDLGSQLLAKCMAPKRGQFLVDFCAGAGGKTLALGAALKNTGRIYALDVTAARLARLKPRMTRSGLSNVWPTVICGVSDERVKRLAQKADGVLVDAPCSGLGTLRRNPDLKWRMTPERIAMLTRQQGEILVAAARCVKPGGRLVYATCSPLAAETVDIVDGFLNAHPEFRRVSTADVLEQQRIALPPDWGAYTAQGDLLLWPHRTGTDGFYAAVMTRGLL